MKSFDKDYSNRSDEELIACIHNGESQIADYILEKYKPLVRKKANAMYLIGGETDDLIQEGMIGLFKAIRDYEPTHDASFFRFAELCINRQIYSAVQMSNRKKHLPLNSYVSISTGDREEGGALEEILADYHAESPEQIIIGEESQQALYKELKDILSPMEQEVFAHYIEGLNYTQIAEKMGKSPKSIDNALSRIRQKVRQVAEKYF